MKLLTKCLFYLVLLAIIINRKEQFLSLWTINDEFDYNLDDHTFPFEINYDNAEYSYEALSGYKDTAEYFLVFEDYFDYAAKIDKSKQEFFISTILDSGKIEYLKMLNHRLSTNDEVPIISAAIYAKNIVDLCFIIDATRNIPIIVSLVINKSFFHHGYLNEADFCSTFPYADTFNKTQVWFPNNLLRNVARLPGNNHNLPDLYLSIDVDLIPSTNFLRQINHFLSSSRPNDKDLLLIIVFETNDVNAAVNVQSKTELKTLFDQEKVQIFHQWCTVCYNYYDYPKWFSLEDKETIYSAYEINYKLSFEPYFIASNVQTPYYDPRFRGYGYNKVVHAYQLAKQKFKFKVLSDTFLVHDGIKSETNGVGAVEQEENTKLFRIAKADLNSLHFVDFNPIVYTNKRT